MGWTSINGTYWGSVGCWENFGEMSTDDIHKVNFSGEDDRHEYGVEFLLHTNMVSAVMGYLPVSSRLTSYTYQSPAD